jgi:hypothetical protein
VTDSVDRHVSRATETEEALQRYLTLLSFARSTILWVGVFLIVGSLVFGVGVGVAVTVAGLNPWVAGGAGVGGSTIFIVTATRKIRRYLDGRRAAPMATGKIPLPASPPKLADDGDDHQKDD